MRRLLSFVLPVIVVLLLELQILALDDRLLAVENPPKGTVTLVVPKDLRKLSCVPMQYLLSNRRISKIHSYSKDLKICGGR